MNSPTPKLTGDTGSDAVLTPFPEGSPTVRGTPHPAFSGAMEGALDTAFIPSVPTENLLDDKLILSAARVQVHGTSHPVLGGIPLRAKIGQGGMGAVYYGVHPRLNQEVAVKVLPFHLAQSQPQMVQRFIREAQIAARVRSPHLVSVIDVNEENGLFYLVMEFVDGKSAGSYLREGAAAGRRGLPESAALEICLGALQGLAAAHAHGVIHRDIKPDNVLIPFKRTALPLSASARTAAGASELLFSESKLADLGLARCEIGDLSMTGANACMGTPGYMAPEQALDARHASKPADVFSAGATLYALLSGESPFGGTSLMQILNSTVNTPHRSILEVRPDISPATAALLDRCLAKQADLRFPDAATLHQALGICRQALDQPSPQRTQAASMVTLLEPGSPAPLRPATSIPTVIDPLPSAPPSRRRSVALLLSIPLLLVLAGTAAYIFGIQASRRNLDAQRELAEAASKLESEKSALAQSSAEIEKQKQEQAHSVAEQKLLADEKARADSAAAALKIQQDRQDTLRREQDQKARDAEDARRRLADNEADRLKRETLTLQALPVAVNTALTFKRKRDWDNVIATLTEPLQALGTKPHPNRAAAELLLKEAIEQKERSRQFKVELDKANDLLHALKYDEARTAFDNLRKLAQEVPERNAVNAGFKIADEGIHKQKLAHAQDLENQAKVLRPERGRQKAAWSKAADAFTAAAAAYEELSEKDGQARSLVEAAECLRKDNNKNGDWTQAATLYSTAAGLYFALGDKHNQGDALAREASCYDTGLNPAGDLRQSAQLYARAAALEGESNNKRQQADCIAAQAGCLFREKSPLTPYDRAAELFKRGDLLYEELGEKKLAAGCLYSEALCLMRGQKTNLNPEARALLQKSAALSRAAGDEAGAKLAETWFK